MTIVFDPDGPKGPILYRSGKQAFLKLTLKNVDQKTPLDLELKLEVQMHQLRWLHF